METFTYEKESIITQRFNHLSDSGFIIAMCTTEVSLSVLSPVKQSSGRQPCPAEGAG